MGTAKRSIPKLSFLLWERISSSPIGLKARPSLTLLKTGKDRSADAPPLSDAETICEAVTRPTMRFVEVKTREQQSDLVLHRTLAIGGVTPAISVADGWQATERDRFCDQLFLLPI